MPTGSSMSGSGSSTNRSVRRNEWARINAAIAARNGAAIAPTIMSATVLKMSRHTNSELPIRLKRRHGSTIAARSRATFSRKMKRPRELIHVIST